jgi:hypothetical protein
MRLIAMKQLTYAGVVLRPGDAFDAEECDVPLLTRALEAPARRAEEDEDKPTRRGRYRRLDMRSED